MPSITMDLKVTVTSFFTIFWYLITPFLWDLLAPVFLKSFIFCANFLYLSRAERTERGSGASERSGADNWSEATGAKRPTTDRRGRRADSPTGENPPT